MHKRGKYQKMSDIKKKTASRTDGIVGWLALAFSLRHFKQLYKTTKWSNISRMKIDIILKGNDRYTDPSSFKATI